MPAEEGRSQRGERALGSMFRVQSPHQQVKGHGEGAQTRARDEEL